MSDCSSLNDDWGKELELLLLRHEEQGARYDLEGMTEADKQWLYLHLKRLEG